MTPNSISMDQILTKFLELLVFKVKKSYRLGIVETPEFPAEIIKIEIFQLRA